MSESANAPEPAKDRSCTGLAGDGTSEDYRYCDDDEDGPCSWCGGSGDQEPDDPLWEGWDLINCKSCGGTGLASKQTIW